MIAVFKLAISFLPGPIQALVLAFVAVLLLIAVFKVIAIVLDAIPFL